MPFETAQESCARRLRETTIGDCIDKGWGIGLCCRACGHDGGQSASLDVDCLGAYDRALTLHDLAERATFRCGHRGAWVGHWQNLHGRHRQPGTGRNGLQEP